MSFGFWRILDFLKSHVPVESNNINFAKPGRFHEVQSGITKIAEVKLSITTDYALCTKGILYTMFNFLKVKLELLIDCN